MGKMASGTSAQLLMRRLGALALAAVVLPSARAQAVEPPSVIVIFDGSGSMWGSLEGTRQSKFGLARDALRRVLAKQAPQTRIGVGSFGHRRGDCNDAEVLRPAEPLDADRIMASVEKLNPRGKGPLTLALREAAKSLANAPGRRSIVLIHDDADNCAQDLCAVAGELRQANIVAHDISIAMKPDDVPKMACLAQTTGGVAINAQTPDQLASALEDAMRLASLDSLPAREPPASAAPQVAGQPEAPAPPARRASSMQVPATGPPGLYLQALLTTDGDPVGTNLHWTIYAEGKPETVYFDAMARNPIVPLAPGRYTVEARAGAISARDTIAVGANAPTGASLVLNAGTLNVRPLAQKTGAVIGDAIVSFIDASRGNGKQAAAGPLVAVLRGSDAALLPAGRYVVQVELGRVHAERAVVVPAGSQGRIDIALNAARVQLSAARSDTRVALGASLFSIDEDDPDSPRGRREVARAAGPEADFVVPPGTYYVTLQQGGAEVREQLAVAPGELVKRTLSVSAGQLELSTKLAGGEQPALEKVSYRVERLDTASGEVWTTTRPAPVLLLPAGRYRVEGRYGTVNVREVRDVEVKAGQPQQVVLEHRAAAVKFQFLSSGPTSDVLWQVRDKAGHTVWTTGQPEPESLLEPGSYTVTAETRERRYEQAIELRTGESKTIQVSAN
jgi:Ca-activated chloride channel family protein